VEEFNRGIYDIIIASDEKSEVFMDAEAKGEDGAEGKAEKPKKRRKVNKRDGEYGVSRGIDFKNVAAVINFDLPASSSSYTHRIGRTARAGRAGIALSFVIPTDQFGKHKATSLKECEQDEKHLAKIIRSQAKLGRTVEPYNLSQKQMEAFRYRMNDGESPFSVITVVQVLETNWSQTALRAVTKVAIREARTKELRQELLRSETLKRYFEENPAELSHLRHDGELGRAARQQAHLKHVPEYLLPKEGKAALTEGKNIGFVPMKRQDKKQRGHKKGKGFKVGRKRDPLKTFRSKRK